MSEAVGNVRTVNWTAVGGCVDGLFFISKGVCGLVISKHVAKVVSEGFMIL